MSGYQRGDARLEVGARELTFRLTLGALADICDRLGVDDAPALAARLRRPTPADIDAVALALLRPVHGASAPGLARLVEPSRAAPLIGRLFEEAFI